MVSATRFSLAILSPEEVALTINKDLKLAKAQADCVALTTELDETNNLLMVSDDKCEMLIKAMRVLQDKYDALLACPPCSKTKKKSPPKVKELGANLSKEKVLQESGNLAPFREGGCRCRTWGERYGSQCGNKAKDAGMCLMHGKKVVAQGSWQLGFYDEHRPEVWAEDYNTKETIAIPKHEKAGSKINWAMSPEDYNKAFGVIVEDPVSDADTIGFSDEEEDLEIEEDEEEVVVTPRPPAEDPVRELADEDPQSDDFEDEDEQY